MALDRLSGEQLAHIQETFSMFDKDNDGAITTREVIHVLRAVGLNPTEANVKQLVEEYDNEGEGMVEFATFIELMERVEKGGDSKEEIDEAFRVFDPSGSGTITSSEFRVIMTSMGETLTEDEVDDMIAFADSQSKGEINYRELMAAMLGD